MVAVVVLIAAEEAVVADCNLEKNAPHQSIHIAVEKQLDVVKGAFLVAWWYLRTRDVGCRLAAFGEAIKEVLLRRQPRRKLVGGST